jgi:hypothetical protein
MRGSNTNLQLTVLDMKHFNCAGLIIWVFHYSRNQIKCRIYIGHHFPSVGWSSNLYWNGLSSVTIQTEHQGYISFSFLHYFVILIFFSILFVRRLSIGLCLFFQLCFHILLMFVTIICISDPFFLFYFLFFICIPTSYFIHYLYCFVFQLAPLCFILKNPF